MIPASPPAVSPAGVGRRGLAAVLDLLVFLLVQLSFGVLGRRLWGVEVEDNPLFHVAVVLFTLLFTCVYMTTLHAVGGQTLGKLLLGVRVVDVDGGPLTPGAAFLRYLAYGASLVPFGFGYVMAGLRRDRRALHDLLAGSRVERLPSRRPPAPAPGSGEMPPASEPPARADLPTTTGLGARTIRDTDPGEVPPVA